MRLTLLFCSRTAARWRRASATASMFRDDFSKLPPGWLSKPVGLLNGAIQEYHYLPHRGVPHASLVQPDHAQRLVGRGRRGRQDRTSNSTCVHDQPERWQPLFVTGDPEWTGYTVSVQRPAAVAGEMAGIVFRYHTNRHYYVFSLYRRQARRGSRCGCRSRQKLASSTGRSSGRPTFSYDVKRYYELKVENDGPKIRALHRRQAGHRSERRGDPERPGRRHGERPGALHGLRRLSAGRRSSGRSSSAIAAREQELAALRAANPQPKLWKKFATPNFGAGRNVRFGDLDGDGRLDMLIAQNIPKVRGDAFDHISCLTAVDARRQGAVADRPPRSAQHAAHQRHAVPDPRPRRRRQERSRHGQGLPDPGARRRDRQGAPAGLDARRAGGRTRSVRTSSTAATR